MQEQKPYNIFPFPHTVSNEKDQLVRDIIFRKFKEPGGLQFHYMMEQFEAAIEKKDSELATIIAYYATNVILSHNRFNDVERSRLIGVMRELLEKNNNT